MTDVTPLDLFKEEEVCIKQPTNILEVEEDVINRSIALKAIEIAFNEEYQDCSKVGMLILDSGLIFKPLKVNNDYVLFSKIGELKQSELPTQSEEYVYMSFSDSINKKDDEMIVLSNDKTIIKTCLDFLKFNFNKE